MRTIIIPTDLTPASTNALHYGINMASAIDAGILLLYVYQVPVTLADVPIIFVSVEELKKESEERLSALKREVEHISSGKLEIRTEARMGELKPNLEELCEEVKPFAIVLGINDFSGLEKVLFSSTLLSITRNIHWPVIGVPPGKQFGTGIKKLGLVSINGDEIDEMPTRVVNEFIDSFHAELHLLKVSDPGHSNDNVTLKDIKFPHLHPIAHLIDQENLVNNIVEFSEKNNLDMVILAGKNSREEKEKKFPSTKELLSKSHIPLLSVHE
jgi:nucleotide-binding universal stress UspA family protein